MNAIVHVMRRMHATGRTFKGQCTVIRVNARGETHKARIVPIIFFFFFFLHSFAFMQYFRMQMHAR